jgi:lactate permease
MNETAALGFTYMELFLSIFPIVLLIYLMTKKNSMPSNKALPLTALLIYFLQLIYFQSDPNLINATVVSGLLTAWVPIMIIWGAILLFKTMEVTGAMDTVRHWLNNISPNPVAQLMIIGWAFAFLIEGASGFGTPAALAAPILVGLGFQPVSVACLALVMNSVPVTFGAVGTPTWFGLGILDLGNPELLAIGFESAIIHSVAALIIPVIALTFVVPWKDILKNIVFVYLSILSCIIPYLALASLNYEFPSLVGGMVGLVFSVFFASQGIGLSSATENTNQTITTEKIPPGNLVKALFPIWGTILVLIITRIQQIGIKGLLTTGEPTANLALGSFGDFSISPALVLNLSNIFNTDVGWSYATLYIPAFIPFFLIVAITIFLYKTPGPQQKQIMSETYQRMTKPIAALLGALVLVKLMTTGGEQAMNIIIGKAFAAFIGENWQYFASYLGAVGAFFSGSNTVSNLTFAPIQLSIAQTLGLDQTFILAAQSVGGAMGNMVCINNIVAVCSILGIVAKEGFIIKRTIWPMLIYGVIAAVMSIFLVTG